MWTGTGARGAPGACAAERVGQERDSGRGNVTTPRKFPSCPTARCIPFCGSFLDVKNCVVTGDRIVRLSLRTLSMPCHLDFAGTLSEHRDAVGKLALLSLAWLWSKDSLGQIDDNLFCLYHVLLS